MLIVLGFGLLFAGSLGILVLALAIVTLIISLGMFLISPLLPPLLPAAGVTLVVGASAFVAGLVLVAVGSLSLLFAPVRAFLTGLKILFDLVRRFLPSFELVVPVLDATVAVLGLAKALLENGVVPALTATRNAIAALPDIPTPSFQPLWHKDVDQDPPGLVNPILGIDNLADDVHLVTGVTFDSIESQFDAFVGPLVPGPGPTFHGLMSSTVNRAEAVAVNMGAVATGLAEVADLLRA